MSDGRLAGLGTPSLVITGRIATLRGPTGMGWVEAVAISGDRIVAAGGRSEVESLTGRRTRHIDLPPDLAAMPGLTDAHLHLADAAIAAEHVDLSEAVDIEDGLQRLRAHAVDSPPSLWLEGHGWDADRWGGWPTADALERVAPRRLVAIWAHDHHALWVSHAALDAAGVSEGTGDPAGGLIRRGPHGRPSGVLHETAARLVSTLIPPPTVDRLVEAIERLSGRLLEAGIVAVQDPGSVVPDADLEIGLPAYRRLAEIGRTGIRIDVSVRQEALESAIDLGLRSGAAIGPGEAGVRVGWLKLFADGTLGSRTAAMLEPFDSAAGGLAAPGDGRGIFLTPPGELKRLAARAADAGIASQIHAIGDGAIRAALDALEPTAGTSPVQPRVEHVQLVHPADLGRFAASGIAASVQPIHLRSDLPTAAAAWGVRAERSGYPWRALADSGALLPFGSDAPVEPWEPWPGIEIAVTRAAVGDGLRPEGGWPSLGPGQGLDLPRAFRAACVDAPMSAGEVDRGSLAPGMRADIIVVPVEALAPDVVPAGPLGRCRPRLVIVAGRVVIEH